ncbi:MAG: histidinol-phosphate aminotransferase family protein [Blastochloris sp.]|nr:histidinol-phosphate aminotransferase family protein [Blastochloris sp.]
MIRPKHDILNTVSAHHGAFDYAELNQLGLSPDEIIDFSVNSNPYGPPPGVREAITSVPLDRYPDRECLALRHKLAELHKVGVENIVVGNGTAELLQLLAFAFLEREASALMPKVTFSEYARVVSLTGATINDWDLAGEGVQTTPENVRLAFLCNPNNPDGSWIPLQAIQNWAQFHPQTLLAVDEAYSNFMHVPQTVIGLASESILSIRSLTKDYALAGLRLGYVVGQPEIIEAIRRVRPAWNVNALAQAAGIAVLNSHNWLNETMAQLYENKANLIMGLQELGLNPLPSATHYFLVNVDDGQSFRSQLLTHKVMVRDCASFGLPEHARIATRTPEDNARLLNAVERVLA